MILPTKRLTDRALLRLGGDVLGILGEPKTVSRLWEELKKLPDRAQSPSSVTYDWFVLTLDFLYALRAIELTDGLLRRSSR